MGNPTLSDEDQALLKKAKHRMGVLKRRLEKAIAKGNEKTSSGLRCKLEYGEAWIAEVEAGRRRGAMSRIADAKGVSRQHVSSVLGDVVVYDQRAVREGDAITEQTLVSLPGDVARALCDAGGTLDQDRMRAALERGLESIEADSSFKVGWDSLWLYLTRKQKDRLDRLRNADNVNGKAPSRSRVLIAALERGLNSEHSK